MTLHTLQNRTVISLVSYLNTRPFLFGLQHSPLHPQFDIQLDIPSGGARKILMNQVDIALAPVAVLPHIPDASVITDYCIGATDKVQTVCVFSDVPMHDIKCIYLDDHSLTSVQLLKILLHEYWHHSPEFKASTPGYIDKISGDTAALVIGDKSFGLKHRFRYTYDLAEAWHLHTGLPFVFAAWITRKNISPAIIESINAALKTGIEKLNEVISENHSPLLSDAELKRYYTENISYLLDTSKKDALELFLQKMKQYNYTGAHIL